MEVRYDEGMVNCLDALQDNAIAQLLSRLLKQNAAIKKCLAQMIRNQEEISQQNNEAFFEECVEKRESTLLTRETLLFSATRTNNVKETMRDLSLEKTRVTGGPSELNNKQKDQCCIY